MNRSLSEKSLNIFNDARRKNLYCDAVLETEDGGYFNVHKCILVICSSYFNTLFTKTGHGKRGVNFLIRDISKNILNSVINYAYVHKINLDLKNIKAILSAANQLHIVSLIDVCSRFLVENIDAENCINIQELAERFCLFELSIRCCQYLKRNFMNVVKKNKELMNISGSELVSILNCDELNVNNEEMVWETAIRWINENEDVRKHYIVDLMSCVRFGLVNEDYFMDKIKKHPLVLSNDECHPLVSETLRFFNVVERPSENKNEFYRSNLALPRIPNEIVFVIGGWSSSGPNNCIETYDTRANRWMKMDEIFLDEPRACHRCVVINNEIFIIGGFDGKMYCSGCCCFNVITKQWKDIGPMHYKRSYVSVVVLDGVLYAMGGYDGRHRQSTAEKYDRFNNQWTMIASMHYQRSDASAAILNGCVYITGGFNGHECLQSVEFYSPLYNRWTLITPMRNRRSGLCCVAYKGQLYVLGGFNGRERIQSVEQYNPRNGTWNYASDMLIRRSNFATEVIDTKIFAIGGYDGNTITSQVEYYNEASKQWHKAADMNMSRFALAVCVVGNIPNVRDYICNKTQEEE